ncbi:MAG TPA: hypothetical protein VFT71_01400 [Candidatus Nitrosocosmicus sp.]|nr:hypothetical protein [Candidatus Nitrosocosmicus sp.]
MNRKNIKNRINRKIDKVYNERQKVLQRIRNTLDIDFYKISIYTDNIVIKNPTNGATNTRKEENDTDDILFRVELPSSTREKPRFYYKGITLDSLSIKEADYLEKNLSYILEEIEKRLDEIILNIK